MLSPFFSVVSHSYSTSNCHCLRPLVTFPASYQTFKTISANLSSHVSDHQEMGPHAPSQLPACLYMRVHLSSTWQCVTSTHSCRRQCIPNLFPVLKSSSSHCWSYCFSPLFFSPIFLFFLASFNLNHRINAIVLVLDLSYPVLECSHWWSELCWACYSAVCWSCLQLCSLVCSYFGYYLAPTSNANIALRGRKLKHVC